MQLWWAPKTQSTMECNIVSLKIKKELPLLSCYWDVPSKEYTNQPKAAAFTAESWGWSQVVSEDIKEFNKWCVCIYLTS